MCIQPYYEYHMACLIVKCFNQKRQKCTSFVLSLSLMLLCILSTTVLFWTTICLLSWWMDKKIFTSQNLFVLFCFFKSQNFLLTFLTSLCLLKMFDCKFQGNIVVKKNAPIGPHPIYFFVHDTTCVIPFKYMTSNTSQDHEV